MKDISDERPAVPRRPVVLLAEDSATVRTLVAFQLEDAGYDVVQAADGQEAVHAARRTRPDVILLDVEMPVMDGYEALGVLKADPDTCDVPVVFLTGRTGTDDVVDALRRGAHDYLRKPPEAGELLARVGAALRVKQLQDELRHRADELDRVSRTDYLTGLHNRRHIEEQLAMVLAGARRHRYDVAVLVVDVDHFKRVNDTYGHAAGDAVLCEVSARLRDTLRTEDVLGRWGGEEFLVVAPHTGTSAAWSLAERLRAAVASRPVVVDGAVIAVTASIGGSATEGPAEHLLLQEADANLYAAKEGGRNACVVTGSAVLPLQALPLEGSASAV